MPLPGLYAVVVLAGSPAKIEAAMQESHDTNYLGPVLLAREAAARMRSAGTQGAIVLTSTMQANALFAGSTAYAAQKAALQHAARILAKECRYGANIRVNVVSPGVTAAGMAEPASRAAQAGSSMRRLIATALVPYPSRYPLRDADRRDLRGRSRSWMLVDVTLYKQEQARCATDTET